MHCYTCSSSVMSPTYSCITCNPIRQAIYDGYNSIATQMAFDSYLTQSAIDGLSYTLGNKLEDISVQLSALSETIHNGFLEIRWELEQQTNILKSIDATLKSPAKTAADEQRQMADELFKRGDLAGAIERYQDAKKTYPLDFRTYKGLAYALIVAGRLQDAFSILQDSIKHAPNNRMASYSYAVMGRIAYCFERVDNAKVLLVQAVNIDPTHADARYDFAKYCAELGQSEEALPALKIAVDYDLVYWQRAHSEQSFQRIQKPMKEFFDTEGMTIAATNVVQVATLQRSLPNIESQLLKISEKYEKFRGQTRQINPTPWFREIESCSKTLSSVKSALSTADTLTKGVFYPDCLRATRLAMQADKQIKAVNASLVSLDNQYDGRKKDIASEVRRNNESRQAARWGRTRRAAFNRVPMTLVGGTIIAVLLGAFGKTIPGISMIASQGCCLNLILGCVIVLLLKMVYAFAKDS